MYYPPFRLYIQKIQVGAKHSGREFMANNEKKIYPNTLSVKLGNIKAAIAIVISNQSGFKP